MAFETWINIAGRPSGHKGGRLFAMAYGALAITPRNLSQALAQMKNESALTGTAQAGQRQHKPLTITKELGASSPQLFNAHWTSEILQDIEISITSPGPKPGQQVVYQRITLTNALIGRYKRYMVSLKPKEGGGRQSRSTSELEEFELTFQKITYENVGKSTSASDDWTA